LRVETGVSVETLRADLTVAADVARVAQRLSSDAAISMLVNNAGVAVSTALIGADPDALENMISLNVVAVTRLAVAAAGAFAAREHGTLINVASALALAPKGVRVQAVLPGATHTELWARAGFDIANLPSEMVMEVGEMVDAALVGLELGETVTIPSLPEIGDWNTLNATRLALAPRISLQHAASRYGKAAS
jgi:short-subunit dehydrogenase